MKARIVFLSFLLVLSLVPSAFAASAPTKDEMIIGRQREFFDAIIKRDLKKMSSMIASGYLGTYSLGTIDRAKELEDLKSFPLAAYEMTNTKASFPSGETAIVTFHLHVRVVVDGKDAFEDDNVSCIWIRMRGQWLLAAQTAVKTQ